MLRAGLRPVYRSPSSSTTSGSIGAENGACDLRPAGAHQAGHADDLAGAEFEAHPFEVAGRVSLAPAALAGASAGTGAGSGNCCSSFRPSIEVTRLSSALAAGEVFTKRPSFSTVTESQVSSRSASRWET